MRNCAAFSFVYALFISAGFAANAQQDFELSAQLVCRPEMRGGYRTLPPEDAEAAFFISQRTRLNAGFSNERIKFGLSLQDARVWGEEPQVSDAASLGLHEGWAEINLGKNAALKAGRQELVYDDHRLFGNLDWVPQGRSHDAVVFIVRSSKYALHLGGAYNQASANLYGNSPPNGNYHALGWLWYKRKFNREKIELSLYAVTDGIIADSSLHTDKTFFRGTAGPMINFVSGKMKANTTIFGQLGKDVFGKRITAFFTAVYLDLALTDKFNAAFGYEYISGNDPLNSDAGESHKFNTLYATNHKFYGYMDYFLDLPKDTRGGGLQDAFLKLKYKISSGIILALNGHYFLLSNKVVSPDGRLVELPLGTELDLTVTNKINAFVKAEFGFSAMFGQESLEVLNKVPGGTADETGIWSYVMLTVNPILFKSQKEK